MSSPFPSALGLAVSLTDIFMETCSRESGTRQGHGPWLVGFVAPLSSWKNVEGVGTLLSRPERSEEGLPSA